MPDFKYDELYRAVAQTGVTCPPISSLQAINRIEAYRYVFADTSNNFNHKPVGEAGRLTHFELFEYTTCDLSQKFAIIESLP